MRLAAVLLALVLAAVAAPAASAATGAHVVALDCNYLEDTHTLQPVVTVERTEFTGADRRVSVRVDLFDGGAAYAQLSAGKVNDEGEAIAGAADVDQGEQADFRPWGGAFGDGGPGGDPLEYDHDYGVKVRIFDFDTGDVEYTDEGTCATPPAPDVRLTVLRGGAGSGTVSGAGGAIACGSTCEAELPIGTAVTLTATPAAGSVFSGWSGGGCGGTGACSLTLEEATTVQAVFDPAPPVDGGGPPACIGRTLFTAFQALGFSQHEVWSRKLPGQPFFSLSLNVAPGEMQVCELGDVSVPGADDLRAGWSAATGLMPFPVRVGAGTREASFNARLLLWRAGTKSFQTKIDPAASVDLVPKLSTVDLFDPLTTGIDLQQVTAFKVTAPIVDEGENKVTVESTPVGTLALQLKGEDFKCMAAQWADQLPLKRVPDVMSQAMAFNLLALLRGSSADIGNQAARFPGTLGTGLRGTWAKGVRTGIDRFGPLSKVKWGLPALCKLRVRFPRLSLSPQAARAMVFLAASAALLPITVAVMTRYPIAIPLRKAAPGAGTAAVPKALRVTGVRRPDVKALRAVKLKRRSAIRAAQEIVDLPARGRILRLATDVRRFARARGALVAALKLPNRRSHGVRLVLAGPRGYRAERMVTADGGRMVARVALPRRKAKGLWTLAVVDASRVRATRTSKMAGTVETRLAQFRVK